MAKVRVTQIASALGRKPGQKETLLGLGLKTIRRTRDRGGSGIGLTISRALVEAHGGGISARSAGRGAGATFVVRLPGLSTR